MKKNNTFLCSLASSRAYFCSTSAKKTLQPLREIPVQVFRYTDGACDKGLDDTEWKIIRLVQKKESRLVRYEKKKKDNHMHLFSSNIILLVQQTYIS